MEIIILKSAACLVILMVFYKLFLENLAIHKFKRFYLLGALVVSIVIPFITFIKYVEPTFGFGSPEMYMDTTQYFPAETMVIEPEPINYSPIVLWSIYGLGVLLFASKFCINLFRIVSKINKNEKQKHSNFISVLLNDLIVPHTFFSYIFLNKTKFEAKAIPQEVLLHEQTHASQKHSLDILFIELFQIVFWFNPLLYFIKKDIKLNHEFLADDAVLKQGIDSSTYQETLLQFTSNANEVQLANAINYSLIKKRFTIMKTQTSKKAIWLRSLLLLPLLGGLLFSFSSTEEVEKEVVPAMAFPSEMEASQLPSLDDILTEEQKLLIKTSQVMYIIDKEEYYKNATFKIKDLNKNTITTKSYDELTEVQKLLLPPPPSKPMQRFPSQKEINDWLDINKYGVWLDGKRINNKLLNTFSPSSFAHFFHSKLENNAKNYGNHHYQINLFTQKAFDKAYPDNIEPLTKEREIFISVKNKVNTQTEKPTLTVNGIICDGCELNLSKDGVKNIILSTTSGDNILSFKIKFPGYPTESIKGDALNAKAIQHLSKSNLGVAVQLFDIKTVNKEKIAPVIITLVNKNDKNYSHSPVVKKGEISNIPPPPAPPSKDKVIGSLSGFSNYINQMEKNGDEIFYNNKKIEAKDAISLYKKQGKIDILVKRIARGEHKVHLSEAKGAISTMESLYLSNNPPSLSTPSTPSKKETKTGFIQINGENHFYANNNGVTKYYNRWGNEVDKKGNKLSTKQTEGDKVIPGQKITKVYKDDKVVSEFKKTWEDGDTNSLFYSSEKNTKLNATKYETIESIKNLNGNSDGYLRINNETYYYSKKDNIITYYNRYGAVIDENGKELDKNLDTKKSIRKKILDERKEKREAMLTKRKTLESQKESREDKKEAIANMKEARKEMLLKRKDEIEERKKMMMARRNENRKSLAEQFKGMEKKGSQFFYEGEKISENKAIKLVKENPKLNVSMHNSNGKGTVHLSKKGIKTVNGKLVEK